MFCFTRYDKVIVIEAILFRALESGMQQSDPKRLQFSVFSLVLLVYSSGHKNEQLKLMLLRRLKWRAVARSSTLASVNL